MNNGNEVPTRTGTSGLSGGSMRNPVTASCIPYLLLALAMAAPIFGCSDDGGEAGPPQEGASLPRIVTLNVSEATLVPGESLVISAVVLPGDTDAEITGGMLLRGATQVASFDQISPNNFEVTAPWESWVDETMQGAAGMLIGISLTAQFVDTDGRLVTEDVQFDLACASPEEGVCQSTCLVTDTKHHCGGCNYRCGEDVDGTSTFTLCDGKACGTASVQSDVRRSCADICADATYLGTPMRCDPSCLLGDEPPIVWKFGGGDSAGLIGYGESYRVTSEPIADCDAPPPATLDWSLETLPYLSQDCCCVANF